VIRADLTLVPDPVADPQATAPARLPGGARTKQTSAKAAGTQAFPPPAAIPSWARPSGRAGEDPLFAAGAALALLDAHLRGDPPAAGALRQRLALHSAAASAKILRLNADTGALRDLRFAVTDEPPPVAKLLRLWREPAGRLPSLDSGRIRDAAAALDFALADAGALTESLREQSRAGDPVSAAAKAAAAAFFSAFPDAPAAEAEVLALWLSDLVLAIRLGWRRPMPLIATRILDPSIRPDGARGGRGPHHPGGPIVGGGAIAPPAAAAVDLAADLARRAETLVAVAPKLRAKPAQRIIHLLLTEDCVSPAEAARQAPMTDRAARRLFDRLVALAAARELSGRPTFRLYGL